MKTDGTGSTRARRGVLLMECLVYMAVSVVLLGIATMALYEGLDNMKALRSNADDIARALQAGELWREDVRSATGPIHLAGNGETIEIPNPSGNIFYRFADARVSRRTGLDTAWRVVLPRVQRSQMAADARQGVTAWRWELELKTSRRAHIRVHPLFTFFAVPGITHQQ